MQRIPDRIVKSITQLKTNILEERADEIWQGYSFPSNIPFPRVVSEVSVIPFEAGSSNINDIFLIEPSCPELP